MNPHLEKDLHFPFRGLPELLILKAYPWTDKIFLCCHKLITKILAFNTKLSKQFKLEEAMHMYMRWMSSSQHFPQKLCSLPNLSFLLLFLHFHVFLSILFSSLSSFCCDFSASFSWYFFYTWKCFFSCKWSFSTQCFLRAHYFCEVVFNPLYIRHMCQSWIIRVWLTQ